MKVLYIDALMKNKPIILGKNEIKKLPKKLFLAYSLQYKGLAKSIKKQLTSDNIIVSNFSQVLGCSKIKTKLPILLISSGKFHAQNLFLQALAIYVLEGNKIIKITEQEIKRVKARKRTALIKYLNADKVGILVSTKPGQNKLDEAIKLKNKLKMKNMEKDVFIFISNNIDLDQFENFFIDSWINTACPGIAFDHPGIINIEDLSSIK